MSTIVNQSTLRPYVFRNYRHRHELKSHYPGSCSHKLWEALRASSAAPGYFEEFKLGRDIHQVMTAQVQISLGSMSEKYSSNTAGFFPASSCSNTGLATDPLGRTV